MTGICKYSKCSAPPTCYRHYDAVNDCVYYDHTPNTESVTVSCPLHALVTSEPYWYVPSGQ